MSNLSIIVGVFGGFFYGQSSLARYRELAQQATAKTSILLPTILRYATLLFCVGVLIYTNSIDPLSVGVSFLAAFWIMILWGIYRNEN